MRIITKVCLMALFSASLGCSQIGFYLGPSYKVSVPGGSEMQNQPIVSPKFYMDIQLPVPSYAQVNENNVYVYSSSDEKTRVEIQEIPPMGTLTVGNIYVQTAKVCVGIEAGTPMCISFDGNQYRLHYGPMMVATGLQAGVGFSPTYQYGKAVFTDDMFRQIPGYQEYKREYLARRKAMRTKAAFVPQEPQVPQVLPSTAPPAAEPVPSTSPVQPKAEVASVKVEAAEPKAYAGSLQTFRPVELVSVEKAPSVSFSPSKYKPGRKLHPRN
jgi:hypothetical protein